MGSESNAGEGSEDRCLTDLHLEHSIGYNSSISSVPVQTKSSSSIRHIKSLYGKRSPQSSSWKRIASNHSFDKFELFKDTNDREVLEDYIIGQGKHKLVRSSTLICDGEMLVADIAPHEMACNSTNNSDDTSNNSPSNSAPHEQRRKRRSAAERRASHRRRSSQANDPQQLVQLLNDLQQRRNSQEENNDNGVEMLNGEQTQNLIEQQEEHGGNRRLTDCSLILDQAEQQFPPEPALLAPGGDDDEIEQETKMVNNDAMMNGFQCGLASTDITNLLGFKPMHQRSISDHLLRYDQSTNSSRLQQELSATDAIHPSDDNLQNSNERKERQQQQYAHLFQPNLGINKRADVSRKPPLLAHIRRLKQQEQSIDQQPSASNVEQQKETNHWLHSRDSSRSPGFDFAGTNLLAKSLDLSCLGTTTNLSTSTLAANSSSSGFAQLVIRFSAQRQNSDSNLLRRISPKGDDLAGSRRSFRWKSFLRKRHEAGEMENVQDNKLGPVPEDAETIEIDDPKTKRHSAIIGAGVENYDENQPTREFARMRTNSTMEAGINGIADNCLQLQQQQPRPFSVIGTGAETEGELIKYRISREECAKLENFIRFWAKQTPRKSEGGDWDSPSEEEDETINAEEKENYGHADGMNTTKCRKSPPRMGRPVRRNLNVTAANMSPTTAHAECQTLSRPIRSKLQRAVSSRTENAMMLTSTLPRKRPKVPIRGTRGGAAAFPTRRKSIALQIGQQKTLATELIALDAKATTAATMVATAEQQQQLQEQIMVVAIASSQQRLKSKRASMSALSLRHLLAGGDRNRAKVAPRTITNSPTTSAKGKKANKNELIIEQHDEELLGNNDSTCGTDNRDKRREHKGNSMILDTILSIRPRRKKENNTQRNLANLWASTGVEAKGENATGTECTGNGTINGNKGDLVVQSPPSFGNTVQHNHQHSLPPVLSPLFGGSGIPSFGSNILDEQDTHPETRLKSVQARWLELDLWSEQASSWTAKFSADESTKTLTAGERKRQNVIYELLLTERHHCQVLILLAHLYREGLLQSGALTPEQLKMLIPDVLDPLLDFHLTLYRKLHYRCVQSSTPVIDCISDILIKEFESGKHRSAAIESYTLFCLSRDDSHRQHALLMTQNQQFRKFMEEHEGLKDLKERTFKDCLLLIAQRLTKYPVLVEQIVKLESRPEKQSMARRAHYAVRSFAMEVDQQLQQHELNRQWNAVKKALDKGSTAKLVNPDPKDGKEFTVEDLIWPVENECKNWKHYGSRRILLITKVFWRETMDGPDVELRLLLFDDIIVFLRPKSTASNGTTKLPPLQLFRHRAHAGILPLHSTLVKSENLRQKSLFLILTDNPPDLFPLSFSTAAELEQCAQAIKEAKEAAPKFVRQANGESTASQEKPIDEGMAKWDKRKAEAEDQAKMDIWRKELEQIFDQQANVEQRYYDDRFRNTELLRLQVQKMPLGKNGQEQKKQLSLQLKTEFTKMEQKDAQMTANYVAKIQKLQNEDILESLDDPIEGRKNQNAKGDENSKKKKQDGHEHELKTSDDSSEDERRKPRRVSTYHGIVDQKQKRNSGGSSSGNSTAGGAIRRHTTVPGGRTTRYQQQYASSEEEDLEHDELNRLALGMTESKREMVTKLIRTVAQLKSKNRRLEEDKKLNDMIRLSETTNAKKLERSKNLEECENEKLKMELEQKDRELTQLKAQLKAQEEKVPTNGNNNNNGSACHNQSTISPNSSTPPVRKFSSPKSDGVPTQNNRSIGSTPTATTTSTATVRISNTYCGAGPVPAPNGGGNNSVGNSPTLLLNADRRAISQTELPRHLVSKTETKQKQKRK